MDLSLAFVNTLSDFQLRRVSCMRKLTLTQYGAPSVLLAGLIFHTNKQRIDSVKSFNVLLDSSAFYFAYGRISYVLVTYQQSAGV